MNAEYLTVRNLPKTLAAALQEEKRRRGQSLNQTVVELLEQSLGTKGPRSNGIRRLAGTGDDCQPTGIVGPARPVDAVEPALWGVAVTALVLWAVSLF